jgi:hypothetical protein
MRCRFQAPLLVTLAGLESAILATRTYLGSEPAIRAAVLMLKVTLLQNEMFDLCLHTANMSLDLALQKNQLIVGTGRWGQLHKQERISVW